MSGRRCWILETLLVLLMLEASAAEAVFSSHQQRVTDILDFDVGSVQTVNLASEKLWEDGTVATLGDLRWEIARRPLLTPIQGRLAVLDHGQLDMWVGKRVDHVLSRRINGQHNPFLQLDPGIFMAGTILVYQRDDRSKTVVLQVAALSDEQLRIIWTDQVAQQGEGWVLQSAPESQIEDDPEERLAWLARMWVKSIGLNRTAQAMLEQRGQVFTAMDRDAALSRAIATGDRESLDALLNAETPVGHKHMEAALATLDPKLARTLVAHGGELPQRAATIPHALRLLTAQFNSYTQANARNGSLLTSDELAVAWEILLGEEGCRIQENSDEALVLAVWEGRKEDVKRILEHRDLPKTVSFGFGDSRYVNHPQLHALKAGQADLLDLLPPSDELPAKQLLAIGLQTSDLEIIRNVVQLMERQQPTASLEQAWSAQNSSMVVAALELGSRPPEWADRQMIHQWLIDKQVPLGLGARIALHDQTALNEASPEELQTVNWAGMMPVNIAIAADWGEGLREILKGLTTDDETKRDLFLQSVRENAIKSATVLADFFGEIPVEVAAMAWEEDRYRILEAWILLKAMELDPVVSTELKTAIPDGNIPKADRDAAQRLLELIKQ